MKAQFKYALKQGLTLRTSVFAVTLVLNLVFGILGYFNLLGYAAIITGVSLSGVAIGVVFIVNIIADVKNVQSLYGTPEGYLFALTPVKSRKTLFARIITIVCEDFIALAVSIFGVVWQALILSGDIVRGAVYSGLTENSGVIISSAIVIFFAYLYIINLIFFGVALKNSVFFGMPGRSLITLLSVAAAAWIFSLVDFLMVPFGSVEHWGIFYTISLPFGFNTGFIIYALIALIKIAALFAASSVLTERKNNL